MKKFYKFFQTTLFLLVITSILFQACTPTEELKPTGAEEALDNYLRAMRDGNRDLAFSYITSDSQKIIEEYGEYLGDIWFLKTGWRFNVKILNTELTSDRARVKVIKNTTPFVFVLVKKEKKWLLDFTGILYNYIIQKRHYSYLNKQEADSEDIKKTLRIVHVFVALCDNESQGIVKVSKRLGDGNNPGTNLYWGSAYGVKTFLSNSKNWELISCKKNRTQIILERCIFKYAGEHNVYLVADAYKGNKIKQCIKDVLNSYTRSEFESISFKDNEKDQKFFIKGGSQLIVYVGHNGLMDFKVPKFNLPDEYTGYQPDLAILGCMSKHYFEPVISAATKKNRSYKPMVMWTTNLLAPEAYILESFLNVWIKEPWAGEKIQKAAADAYAKYQKCNKKYANNLFEVDLINGGY